MSSVSQESPRALSRLPVRVSPVGIAGPVRVGDHPWLAGSPSWELPGGAEPRYGSAGRGSACAGLGLSESSSGRSFLFPVDRAMWNRKGQAVSLWPLARAAGLPGCLPRPGSERSKRSGRGEVVQRTCRSGGLAAGLRGSGDVCCPARSRGLSAYERHGAPGGCDVVAASESACLCRKPPVGSSSWMSVCSPDFQEGVQGLTSESFRRPALIQPKVPKPPHRAAGAANRTFAFTRASRDAQVALASVKHM